MNGPDHYREAERELRYATDASIDDGTAGYHLEAAQVHATLALAAATALQPRHFLTVDFRDQIAAPWIEVAR